MWENYVQSKEREMVGNESLSQHASSIKKKKKKIRLSFPSEIKYIRSNMHIPE